ncbi:MAG: glycosyltransferase family 39 protein [Chloroflexota bacterium]|nr:glycosyltransferase family 39 protein [Chloroflexota bacterium]
MLRFPARSVSVAEISRRDLGLLGLILLLAGGLNFFSLAQNGYGNTYYAAAVKSMLLSWSNFFFVSFDLAGFVNVDKPPVGLWFQTLSTRIFGYSGFSLILPQALAGVISVALLFFLVRKAGGTTAGLIAAALLAVSPINLMVNRSNILESQVVLTLLLATWALLRALERQSFGWILCSGLLLGIGFNIKGLEAWLIVPVLLLTYLSGLPLAWWVRFRHLALMLLLMLALSLTWVLTVDLFPASQRPYVDSTLTNSELDLMFNYNGLQRLLGEPSYGGTPQVVKHYKGELGPVRLFQPQLGGQVSWFLPLALVGLVTLVWKSGWLEWRQSWKRRSLLPSQYMLLLWGGWVLTVGGFFSVAHRFNEYYLAVLAPAICAMAGWGAVALWQDSTRKGGRGWLLLIAFAATGLEQLNIINNYPDWNSWQLPLLIGICVGGVLLLATTRTLLPRRETSRRFCRYSKIINAAVGIPLLIVPLWWSSVSFTSDNEGEFPLSGPTPHQQGNYIVPPPDPQLLTYLKTYANRDRFLLATSGIEEAAAVLLATDRPVMALGGFSGYTPILTPTTLAARVANGEVHFFLIPSSNLTESQTSALYTLDPNIWFITSYTNALTHWVSDTCQPVAPEQWQTDPQFLALQLYYCAS